MSDQIPIAGAKGALVKDCGEKPYHGMMPPPNARPVGVTLSTDHQLLVEILAELRAITALLTNELGRRAAASWS